MQDMRLGFIGIVLEDMSQAARVNSIISEYSYMVMARVGVPDHDEKRAVIGLIIQGDVRVLGAFTGKLGNLPGVTVKSAVTKTKEKGDNENEKA